MSYMSTSSGYRPFEPAVQPEEMMMTDKSKSGADYPLPGPLPAPPSSTTKPPPSPYNVNPDSGVVTSTPDRINP